MVAGAVVLQHYLFFTTSTKQKIHKKFKKKSFVIKSFLQNLKLFSLFFFCNGFPLLHFNQILFLIFKWQHVVLLFSRTNQMFLRKRNIQKTLV